MINFRVRRSPPSFVWFPLCVAAVSGCSYDWRVAKDAQVADDAAVDVTLDIDADTLASADGSEARDAADGAGEDAELPGANDAFVLLVSDAATSDAQTPPDAAAGCQPGTCGQSGTCSVVAGAVSCACTNEWTGARCETDVNECQGDHGCSARNPCRNFPGGYLCDGDAPAWRLRVRSGSGASAESQGLQIDTGKGTLLDRNTGLMWQLNFSGPYADYADCRATCEGATTGGFDDWRLPSVIEYATMWSTDVVPDYRLWTNEAQIPTYIWTSTGSPNNIYVLDLAIPYRYGFPEVVATAQNYVQCVRTSEIRVSGTPAQRFTPDTATNSLYDSYTNLTWERTADAAQRSFGAASTYCTGLAGTYRLPTFAELLSLSDLKTERVRGEFLGPDSAYWSSTPSRNVASHTYVYSNYIYWYRGATGDGTRAQPDLPVPDFRVRCVHDGHL